MSAGLEQYDWLLSAKERPWHGIGTVVHEAPTSEEAIKIAKLNWTVEQFPVIANGIEIPGVFANIRSDVNKPLGIVKSRYTILQNNEAFKFVDNIISNEEVECKYETAGSLFNGKRVFMLVKLPNKNLLGDDIENYMFFTNSHNGSSSMMAGITNVRVVCNNTLQMAIKGAKRVWTCRHTSNIKLCVREAQESLGLAVKYLDNMDKIAWELASKKINEEQFFRKLFDANPCNRTEKSREEAIERIHIIFNEKDDLQNFKGTAWGMYNAVADFCSNTVPQRKTIGANEKKLADFFDGYNYLNVAQDILMVA